MFSIFRNTRFRYKDFAHLGTDIHSHLIPGIDDGAKDMNHSIRLIRRLIALGFKKIITTPHIMGEYYPNTPEKIKAGLRDVRSALQKEKMNIPIDAAAEYYVDEFFEKLLEEETPLLTLPGNRILIEMSFMAPPQNLSDVIFRLKTRNYQPILAHPERYIYWSKQLDKFEDLKIRGCTFQLNLLSLTGYYGKPQKKLGLQLLKTGLIDFVGTDLHHEQHADHLQRALKDSTMLKCLNNYEFSNGLL